MGATSEFAAHPWPPACLPRQDATAYLNSHGRADSAAISGLLINHPLGGGPDAEAFMRVMSQKHLAAPAQAHALATRYGSLSGLMAMLLDPTRWVGVSLGRRSSPCQHIAMCLIKLTVLLVGAC